jgi:chromosome segregation ATPase
MAKSLRIFPGLAAFLAGVAAGVVAGRTRGQTTSAAPASEMKSGLSELEARIATLEAANATRFGRIEAKLEEHDTRLTDVPSTAQIVSAMEQILARTMSSLDERLNVQSRSIESLKTAVAQTDGLLERVLESLDSLQSFTEPAGFADDNLLRQRPA